MSRPNPTQATIAHWRNKAKRYETHIEGLLKHAIAIEERSKQFWRDPGCTNPNGEALAARARFLPYAIGYLAALTLPDDPTAASNLIETIRREAIATEQA